MHARSCITVSRVSSLIRDWPLRFVIDVYDPCYRLRSVFRSHIRVSGRISSRPLGIGMSSKYFLSVVRSVFVRQRGLRGPLWSYVDWACRGHLTPLRNILHQGFYVNFMWMSPGGGASNIWTSIGTGGFLHNAVCTNACALIPMLVWSLAGQYLEKHWCRCFSTCCSMLQVSCGLTPILVLDTCVCGVDEQSQDCSSQFPTISVLTT